MAVKHRQLLLGLALGAVFLVLAFRRVEVDALLRAVADFNFWWLPFFVASHLASLWLRSWRWQAIISPIKPVGLRVLFPITVRGFLITNLLPLKAGDLYRFYALGQRTEISKTTAMGTLLVERLADLTGLVLLSVFLALLVPLPEGFTKGLWWTAVAVLGAAALWWVSRRLSGLLGARGGGGPGRSPWAEDSYAGRILESLRQGFAVLQDLRQWVTLLVVTSIMFCISYLGILVILVGFGLGGVSPLAPLALLTFVFWSSLLPQAPAGVGTFEYASLLALQLFGVGREEALAVALMIHAVVIVDLLVFNGIIHLAPDKPHQAASALASDRPVKVKGLES